MYFSYNSFIFHPIQIKISALESPRKSGHVDIDKPMEIEDIEIAIQENEKHKMAFLGENVVSV